MFDTQTMSTLRRDFVASHLRCQLDKLRGLLDSIEEEIQVDGGYANDCIREIETNLKHIRKICV